MTESDDVQTAECVTLLITESVASFMTESAAVFMTESVAVQPGKGEANEKSLSIYNRICHCINGRVTDSM